MPVARATYYQAICVARFNWPISEILPSIYHRTPYNQEIPLARESVGSGVAHRHRY